MTKIPDKPRLGAAIDQKPRTFTKSRSGSAGGPIDSTEWTMTPADRERARAEKLLAAHSGTRKRSRLQLKPGRDDTVKQESAPAVTSGESLVSLHQNKRRKGERRQIGGTVGFSFKAMREDRRFNEKEAKGMKSMGKKLSLAFSKGQVYKSQI